MNQSLFISLWVGSLDCARNLPAHLEVLYRSIGPSSFERDPEVCAERECVPVEELLEPFSLAQEFVAESIKAAKQQSLHLASVVVAVYTREQPKLSVVQVAGCGLRYLGTFSKSL